MLVFAVQNLSYLKHNIPSFEVCKMETSFLVICKVKVIYK